MFMRRITFILSLLSISQAGYTQLVERDTNRLSEVLISENRLQIPFNKTARNLQVITREEIRQLSVKSINEVLAFLGGVDVRQRGPFGAQADIGMDGGSFEQTLILLNGVKMSDSQTAHHSMNLPIPLDAVERIEILKGPAARIYGINALTGAINIVTQPQESTSFLVHTQVGSGFQKREEEGENGFYTGGSLQLLAQVGRNDFRNLVAISQDLTNGQRYNTAAQTRRAFYQADLQLNDDNKLQWMVGNIQNAFGANGYYAAPNDKEAEEIVNTSLLSIGSQHSLANQFTLKSRFSYRYNSDDYRFNRHNIDAARSEHRTDVLSAEVNAVKQTAIGDFGVGWESRSEKIESTSIGERERYNHGLYAEYKTDIAQSLWANVGAYLNYNTQYGWEVFPGIDLAYLFHTNWKVSFNIGSSQRIPSFTDLYLQQAPHNIGNPDLRSENAWQYEGSLQYSLNGLELKTGYFFRNIEGFIDWIRTDNTQPYQAQNFGENKVQGIYFSAGKNWQFAERQNLLARASYNYLDPKDLRYTDNIISKYVLEGLKHQLILRLAYQHEQWDISTSNRYIQRMHKNAYLLSDIRLGYAIKSAQLYVDATNVLDQSYVDVAAVPMPGRWLSLGFRYRI